MNSFAHSYRNQNQKEEVVFKKVHSHFFNISQEIGLSLVKSRCLTKTTNTGKKVSIFSIAKENLYF